MSSRVLASEDREALRMLSRRHDLRAFSTIAVDWALIVLAVALAEAFPFPWAYLLAVLVIARQMNALFEIHHHAIHRNVFSRKRWNESLQLLYSLPLWNTVEADRKSHMEHHRTFDTVAQDHETWGTGYGLDPARRHQRRYMIWFLLIRPFLGLLQVSDLKDLVGSPRWRLPGWRNPVLAYWGGVLALFLAAGRLDLLVWYWLVPRFTVFPILFFWDDMLGHYNCPRTGTREMRGLWFRMVCAHGTNFHNIHHLYPAIPWFNMERATRRVLDEDEVDVARGFIDGMRQLVVARD